MSPRVGFVFISLFIWTSNTCDLRQCSAGGEGGSCYCCCDPHPTAHSFVVDAQGKKMVANNHLRYRSDRVELR